MKLPSCRRHGLYPWSPPYSFSIVKGMHRSLYDVWRGSSHGQAAYHLGPGDQWGLGHSLLEYSPSASRSPATQHANVETLDPTVDPSPSNNSGSLESIYSAFGNPSPLRRRTWPTMPPARLSLHDVSSGERPCNSRAMTLPILSHVMPPTIYSPLSVALTDSFASIISPSQGPIYVPNLQPSPTSIPQDGPSPPGGGDTLTPLGLAVFSGLYGDTVTSGRALLPFGNPTIGDTSTHLPFGGPNVGSASQEVPILAPTPSHGNLLHPTQCRVHARPRQRPSPARGPRAQLSVGSIVGYGDACRLDLVARGGNAVLEYDTVALPGQTFGQKASFVLDLEPYKPFTRQLYVLQNGGQPTKRRLAEVTVRFLEYFIKDCEERGQPFQFKLEHLALLRIEVVSRARIQPIFDIVVPVS